MQEENPEYLYYLEEAVKQSDSIIFVYDADKGKFLYLNPAFEQMWKQKRENVNLNAIVNNIHPDDREYLLDHYRELLSGVKKKEVEFRFEILPGEQRWLSLSAKLINKKGGKSGVVIGPVDDISKWKEQEMLMQKYASKKNSILEILSHDLAGPLNNIKGLSEALTEELAEHKLPQVDKIVTMITQSSERSINLIREFVQHEFLASENSTLVKERVDLVERMSFVVDQYKNSEEDIKKHFELKASTEPILVDIDPYKFSQVVNNLISNAIKFTHDDGHIIVIIEEKKESVLVSVVDNGIGIPEKYHQDLFEKFTNARRPGLRGEPSTGLGMSIIKTIVEWHGGRIWFESEENKGSTFYIELPRE